MNPVNDRHLLTLGLGLFVLFCMVFPGKEGLGQAVEEKKSQPQEAKKKETASDRGKALVHALGCVVCHDIKGHDTTVRKDAPNLTFEGEIVRPDWLFAFLKKPHRIRPAVKARMPDFRLTDREALAITLYLSGLVERGNAGKKKSSNPKVGEIKDVAAAKKLMSKDYFDCFSCHVRGKQKPKGKPEDWAPDLTRVRSRIKPEFFFKWLRNPPKYRPGTKMPAFLPDQDSGPDDILGGDETKQIAVIRDYLLTIGKKETFPAYARVKAKFPDVSAYDGRALMMRLNCVGCHEVGVLPEGKKVGPDLTFQGSRVRKEWLVNFLQAPFTIKPEYALMGSPVRMPTFHFTRKELHDVVEYITGVLVDKKIGGKIALGASMVGKGEKLFGEKRCNNCHRIGNRPGGIGPVLTDAHKRLRAGWIISFIQDPSRYLDTRMPNLKVSAEEAKALAAYILDSQR